MASDQPTETSVPTAKPKLSEACSVIVPRLWKPSSSSGTTSSFQPVYFKTSVIGLLVRTLHKPLLDHGSDIGFPVK